MFGIATVGAVLVRGLGLEGAIFYGIVLILVYEVFIRWPYTSYEKRRRDRKAGEETMRRYRHKEALSAQEQRERPVVEREAAEREAREESEPDPLRRRYYLKRKAAEAERDTAIQAVEQAEQRCQEVINEETERQRQRLSMTNWTRAGRYALPLTSRPRRAGEKEHHRRCPLGGVEDWDRR
jgi:DNA anti-recombination protein RmuC